jgi:hypothetical protein
MTMRDDCLCEAGYWAKRGDKECTECASGRYKNETGKRGDQCTQCQTYSDTRGEKHQGSCICMPGFGKKPWNKTACEKAPCPDVSSVLNQSSTQKDESVCGSGTQTAVFEDTCMVDCGPGSTQVEYVCSTLDKESEGNRATQSHWQEDPAAIERRGKLDCSAGADCRDFADCRNVNLFSQDCHQYAQIVDPNAKKGTADGNPIDKSTGVGWRLCQGYVGKSCFTKCWDNFYNDHDASILPVVNQTYICSKSEGRSEGIWKPKEDGEPLICKPGRLSVNFSKLVTDEAKEVSRQRLYKLPIDKLNGSLFGGSRGPTYSFDVSPRDVYNHPRKYSQLEKAKQEPNPKEGRWPRRTENYTCDGHLCRDYLVAIFQRVPLEFLPESEQQFQPREGYTAPEQPTGAPIYTKEGLWRTGGSKSYKGTMTSIANKDAVLVADAENEPGKVWRITHQFEEHGVFYLSVFMCDYETGRSDCDTRKPSALVEGSFNELRLGQHYQKEGNFLAQKKAAFTVCPQGTRGPEAAVGGGKVFWGANLSACTAIGGPEGEGFFNPYGSGRISAYCGDKGFLCGNPGTTWPVAMPGYWVSYYSTATPPYFPVMQSCDVVGACPGSSLFRELPKSNSKPQFPDAGKCSNDIINDQQFYNFSRSITYPNDDCYQNSSRRMNEDGHLDESCWGKVGALCCEGNFGRACATCCKQDTPDPSCAGDSQWHSVGVTDKQCTKCPEFKVTWETYAAVTAVLIVTAPITSKLSNFLDHARSIQGPLLSIVNFCQS